ncbi:MAG TPA: tRNA (adenosine(37)-N6)-threonylcarbamoyltransferase complex dimerization subunit type 1 TsaB, partial [Polyangiales bacterium]|nr:tRNA (adenosine(37)-N6)-threonylcarbamoyltransferase complex dimerization subunit type 1 TsaB [Polyangiales bacterium]
AHVTSLAICKGEMMIEQHEAADGKHAETLLPSVKALLAQAGWTLAQIDVIGVGVGPGSFTGVRVGVATAKGLGLALQKPVIPVMSLDVLAHEALRVTDSLRIAACLDAFKGELFCAVYTREGKQLQRERAPFHATPDVVRENLAAISGDELLALVGAGIHRYPELLADPPGAWQIYDGIAAPRAGVLAELAVARFLAGDVPELAKVTPVYLRDSDAQLPKVPLRV